MTAPVRPFLSRPWLVTGASLAALALLILLLKSPWNEASMGGSRPLMLYCAAAMTKPVADLLKDYQDNYGVQVDVSYDGSGKLLSTIKIDPGRGDLYLAADAAHIKVARKEGLVAEVIPVLKLRPVVVVKKSIWADLQAKGKPITHLRDVLRDDLRLVLANPELTSIGQLSREAMEKADLWQAVEERRKESAPRVVNAGTVNDVATAVSAGDRFVGIVWSGIAAQFDGLHAVAVPEFEGLYEPMQIGVLAKSKQPTAALRLARFLASADKGAPVFKKHHFEPFADADAWEESPTIHLSAGAMLLPGIDDAVKNFERREGVTVKTSYAGCGLLVGQMKAIKKGGASGQFPDAYFACDTSFLADVQDWFETGILVAKNQIMLVVPHGNPHNIKSLDDLARPDLRVGLAHPTHSALGQLTDRLLRKLGLHEKVYVPNRAKPVVHTDAAHLLINQMRAGALDVAVVYKSNILSAGTSQEHLEALPLDLTEAIASQPFAIAQESKHKHLTRRLLKAIVAPDNAARFQSLGFQWMYKDP